MRAAAVAHVSERHRLVVQELASAPRKRARPPAISGGPFPFLNSRATRGTAVPAISSVAGRRISSLKLVCLLPNLHHLLLCQQTHQLDVLQGVGCDDEASYRGRRAGLGHIEYRQDTGSFHGHAVE